MQIENIGTNAIAYAPSANYMEKTNTPRRILFIDRDGTINKEAPPTYQIDQYEQVKFYKDSLYYLRKIADELDYDMILVTNQDGLGTDIFPENTFWPVQNFIMDTIESQGIFFKKVYIDKTFPHQNCDTRKPGIGMMKEYIDNPKYDLANSYMIGDRITDIQFAKNLGVKGIWINDDENLGAAEITNVLKELEDTIVLKSNKWEKIYAFLKLGERKITHQRNTNETKISIDLNLDGTGQASIETGLPFFNHMLDQIAKHGMLDLQITTKGDLHIDEHHTIEDTAIALGEAFALALGNKLGMERYAFTLPMDDCLAQVAIDFGGRNWIVWDAKFSREKIGDMPTEMFYHFFKSFSDAAKCNLNIKAEGDNEHHKIESIFKAFAKTIKAAVRRDADKMVLPSTKGTL
jgi:imidazoleglycerol-phosphate dehydratase / histidinol-phosphatase